jgi:hypothetical protein
MAHFQPALHEGLKLYLGRTELTAEQWAGLAGVSQSAMYNYLRPAHRGGRVPGAVELRAMVRVLAECLDLPVEDLWEDIGTMLDTAKPPNEGGSGVMPVRQPHSLRRSLPRSP